MSRPNILFICTDQQRHDTIGALGNPVIKTPQLDRLCAEGTAFTSAYSPSPECVPARCSFHYGQYPHNTNCWSNGSPFPPHEDRKSWVGELADAGYRTHAIGKCHFQGDQFRGFQTRDRAEEGFPKPEADAYMTYLLDHGYDHIGDPHGVRGEMYYIPQPAQMRAEDHGTHWMADRAIDFIGEHAEAATSGQQPWMLYVGIIHPHPPFSPPTPWHKLYRAPTMPLPHVPQDHQSLWTWINQHQNRYKYRDQGIDNNLLRNIIAYYYACISFIDYNVGRILATLEETGQLDDTLIVYSSDHGELLGDYHCFGKRSMHDSCARVPMLLRYPKRFAAGARCARPVSLIDIAPTVLAAAGVEHTGHKLDGLDMAALAHGDADRDHVIIEYNQQGKAIYTIITPEWKYAWSQADHRAFLFDRVRDPRETRNHAGMQLYRDTEAAMKQRLIDALNADGPHPAVGADGDFVRYPSYEAPLNPDAGLLIQDMGWVDLSIPGYTDA